MKTLILLSFLVYTAALQCEYFHPNMQPNNCDVITPHYNHSHIDQIELENLKTFLATTSLTSFQVIYKNELILSIGPSTHLNSTITLNQPFMLSLASIIFSDSSHLSNPPFTDPLSKLTPDLKLDIPLHAYLCDILSLRTFDPLDDVSWFGVNVTMALAAHAMPIVEKILESCYGENLRHLVQKTRTVLGLETFRLDQTSEGNHLIRSTTKDILRFGNIVKTLMEEEYSNFSAVYSHFPLQSADLIRGFKGFQFGWWVNGAEFHGDSSNLFKLAPSDMIASLECTHNLYIAPSWDMVILTQRSPKACNDTSDWLTEEKNIWAEIPNIYTLKESNVSRYSMGFSISGFLIIKNFMFYSLYCIVGHVVTSYVNWLIWSVSVYMSSDTVYKHT